ncbi:MAG: polysaccharide biosynthesis tyrosine autokinase [Pirellulales bacterium]
MVPNDADSHDASLASSQAVMQEPPQSGGLMLAEQGFLPTTPAANWPPSPTARGPEILNNPFDPIWLLHSLRRHWILATGMGLLAGVFFGGLVWFLVPSQSTAVALLKVSSVQPKIAFDVEAQADADFDTFRQTQLAMMTSNFVLNPALQDQKIAQLPSVRSAEPDPIAWLQDELRVSFLNDSEVMQVSLELESAEEAEKLVNAVVKAYLDDVVEKERQIKRRAFDALTRVYLGYMDNINGQLKKYQALARELGASESEYADVDRDVAFQHLSQIRRERENIQEQLLEADLALKLMKMSGNSDSMIGSAVASQMESDPGVAYLNQKLSMTQAQLTEARLRARRADHPSIQRLKDEISQLAQEITRVKADARQRAYQSLGSDPQAEFKKMLKAYQLKRSHYLKRIDELDKEFIQVKDEVRGLAEKNIDLETQQSELDKQQQIANDIGAKLETWEVELASPPRVALIQEAQVTQGINRFQRYALVVFGGLFGCGLTCFGIAYWDFGHRRLNGPDQLDNGLGIRVVGSLPLLAFRRRDDDSDPVLAMLMESIDSVRTTLMHASTSKQTRVVMITSALGHEGRSTVASQLAASLARAGRRTLLLDGDLRHPTLHRLFDFPLEDGFCEVLRAEVDVSDVIQPTHAEGLWLLTAGYCDAAAIQALAKEQVQPIFDKVRAEFDFVIIDAAPVLKLSDSLIMGQYADGALLSVLRDVSQVPKIHQASELLRSVGIRVLGSVVNGVREKPDDRVVLLSLPSTTAKAESVAASEGAPDVSDSE